MATSLFPPSPAGAHVSIAIPRRASVGGGRQRRASVRCGIGDLIGGDLIKLDLGRWLSDVEKHKALAIYTPHEGGYEGRYLTRLRYQGYRFLDLSARGLGDPETTLTKIHPICPVSIGHHPTTNPPSILLPPCTRTLVKFIFLYFICV